MKLPEIIAGTSYTDERGTLCFINDFDMSAIQRFYRISHPSIAIFRGWRGHRIEQRWFNVVKGAFKISLIKIDNWEHPNPKADIIHFELYAEQYKILHVPAGYCSGLQALVEESEVLVFADYGMEHAKMDDYLYATNYFTDK